MFEKIGNAIYIHLRKSIINICQKNIVLYTQKEKENVQIMRIYYQNVYLIVIFYSF